MNDAKILEKFTADAAVKLDAQMHAVMTAQTLASPRPTCLRVRADGSLEVVELYDDGKIIEPPKPCPNCGPVHPCSKHFVCT